MYPRLPLGPRRGVLGTLAGVAFLVSVGNGITYQSSGFAWLIAILLGTIACLGLHRLGNPRWLFVDPSSRQTRSTGIPDVRLIAVMGALAGHSALAIVLPNAWRLVDWAIAFGVLAAYTIKPPSRPPDVK